VSEKQAEFYKENLYASFSEIMDMEMMPPPEPPEIPMEEELKMRVLSKIREAYDIEDELFILRERDSNLSRFAEYAVFCEQCQAEAMQELGISEFTEIKTRGELSKLTEGNKEIVGGGGLKNNG